MNPYSFEEKYNPIFIGRDNELAWLDDSLLRRNSSFNPVFITGPAGIGKSELVKYWLSSRKISDEPLWLDLALTADANAQFENFLIFLANENNKNFPRRDRLIVILDGTEIWGQKQHESASGRIFNHKMVSSLIFIRRKPLKLTRSRQLNLGQLRQEETKALLEKLLTKDLSDDELAKATFASQGNPLAISLISQLATKKDSDSINSLLEKPIYEIDHSIITPQRQVIQSVSPIIISANKQIVESLKKQPSDLNRITPRDFEKLIAELLEDLGWEVELTKQTRDGGADILAYLNTDVGRLLCLVEAKHYQKDKKVGVDLVRSLYGTLFDKQANSAMLVTSSTFTRDAKEFQKKHEYQLSLRDYADVMTWILNHGRKE